MTDYLLAGIVPADVPVSLDAGAGWYAVGHHWTTNDAPFSSLGLVGEVLKRITGAVNVTASSDNARSMLVRFMRSFDGTDGPVYHDLGYLAPGETGEFMIDAPVGQLIADGARLAEFYFKQDPPYRTKLAINSASFDFHMSNDAPPPPGPDPGPAAASEIFVHTLNAGKGKWSRYEFPFPVDTFSQLSGELFIRTGDRVVKVVEGKLTDHVDGADVGFTGTVQWPWIDAGQPGVTKQMIGFDLVASGSPSVSFGFNQSDLSMFTTPYAISADTMTGGVIPMPLMSPSFSLRLDFAAGSAWNVRSATIYLNDGKWQP